MTAETGTQSNIETAAPARPVTAGRLDSLDLIRGFAVCGILITNVVGFARPGPYYFSGILLPYGPLESWAWVVQYLLLDGKLRGLFAVLFGAGMAIFVDRAVERRGLWRGMGLQFRRLFWLALFGAVHYYLLYIGDILLDYALAGMLALIFLRLHRKWLLGVGLFLVCFVSVGGSLALWPADDMAAISAPAGSEARTAYDEKIAKMRAPLDVSSAERAEAGFVDMIAWRHGIRPVWQRIGGPAGLEYIGLMLIGAALLRGGFFAGAQPGGDWDRRRIVMWGLGGIALTLVLTAPLAWMKLHYGHAPYVTMFVQFGPTPLLRLPMVLGYAALFIAYAPCLMQNAIGSRLAAAGRMAFSNYIASSFMMGLVFLNWGLGLYGDWNRVSLWLFALGGIALMLLWSRPWLARFRFGPLEWLWRCLTYMRLFPIRREG